MLPCKGILMEWFRIDAGMPGHGKVGRLARRLGVDKLTARGVVVSLWGWCCQSREDGDLSDIEAEDLADGIGWDGDPGALMVALTEAGWIEDTHGGLALHQWFEHQPLLKQRGYQATYRRRCRERAKSAGGDGGDITESSSPTNGEKPTRSRRTNSTNRQTNARADARGGSLQDELIGLWMRYYPTEEDGPGWNLRDETQLLELVRRADASEVVRRWKLFLDETGDYWRGHKLSKFIGDFSRWAETGDDVLVQAYDRGQEENDDCD